MCGIAGIFNVDGRPVSTDVLKAMTDVIRHRGPDGEGVWSDGCVGLGHRRLAIIDLTDLGHQPMESDDGFVITYNGEVYNYLDLRKELESEGFRFRSKTDTEVVLNAYRAWGRACVHRFNGMFAFAVWNQKENTLFLARDRYGIKPLYYYFKNNLFLFGSEIKSILQHPAYSVDVSIHALNEYFSFQNVFSDLTLFKDIHLLPAAHTMEIRLGDGSSTHREPYWDYRFEEDDSLSEEEYVEALTSRFEQAVNRQLVGDVEVGSYLSGGIDSGSVTCVAARQFEHLKTFTCGFDLSSASGLELACDERGKAEFLSYKYRTEHYEVVLKAGDMERVMHDLIWHLEDLRVGQSYPNYYVSRLASKFVKVMLSGAGGDELFAGYPWRYFSALENEGFDDYADKYYRYWIRLIPDRVKPQFYQPEVYPEVLAHPTKDVFRSILEGKSIAGEGSEAYINNSLYFEIKTFLHGLFLVEDKLSMAHGLETRVPFLDDAFVDLALRVPVRYKLKNLTAPRRIDENVPGRKVDAYFDSTNDGKLILRRVLSQFVPDGYADGNKQGFSAPDATWFKGESIDYIKDLLTDKKARIYEFLQPQTVQSLLDEHFSGTKNRRLLIWSLLSFEWWNRIFN